MVFYFQNIIKELMEKFSDQIKVSVIVPVYNTQTYLSDTLKSIRQQTLKEIEIICVDDGSTDDSVQIIHEQMKEDSRIKCLQQKNSYAGVARNHGFSIATGEYVIFWDADDLFDPSALEKMYDKAKSNDADICVCAGQKLMEDTGKYILTDVYLQKKWLPEKEVFSRKDIPDHIFAFATNVPWNKMYKREFVQKYDLKFQNLRQANDTYFVIMSLYFAEKIVTVKDRLITYRSNNSSSLTGKASDTQYCAYDSYKATWEELKKQKDFDLVKKGFQVRFVGGMLYALTIQSRMDKYQLLYERIKEKGLDEFEIDTLSREDFDVKWHYEACQNMKNWSYEEYLIWDLRRLNRNREIRNVEVDQYRLKVKQLKAEVKALKLELRSANANLNRKCVRTAMKIADVLAGKR